MAEKLKELLEKINQEGVKQAEEKAKAIETKAREDAKKIIETAEKEADAIVERAREDAEKTQQSTEAALRQAARDLILSLKEEVRKIFNKIITAETRRTMSPADMRVILENLIVKYIEKNGESSDIKVLLKKDDLDKLKDTFISKLQEKLKEGIEFRPSPNIDAGFSISFDKGKSFFDFTDEGLREALSAFLSQEVTALLK